MNQLGWKAPECKLENMTLFLGSFTLNYFFGKGILSLEEINVFKFAYGNCHHSISILNLCPLVTLNE